MAETGEPLEIDRKGKRLMVVASASPSRLDRLPKRPSYIKVDPEDLI